MDTPGERLRQFRDSEQLSMAQLAGKLRPATTASNINKLEKGQVELTMEWARRLGDALGHHPLDFFDAQPKLPPEEQAIVDIYRGMGEADRSAWRRVGDALTQRPERSDGLSHARNRRRR